MRTLSLSEEAFASDEDWKDELDVDLIIQTLVDARQKPVGTEIKLAESQIILLIDAVTKLFVSQPILLELDGPLNICGTRYYCF